MIRQLESQPLTADRDLETRVVNNLVLNHVPGVRWLNVRACNGVVTLRGRLRSFHQRQRCIHCSRRVAGVFELIDRLEVVDETPMMATT